MQDNCEERELCFQALCEQVSLRISSIDGTPVPAPAKTPANDSKIALVGENTVASDNVALGGVREQAMREMRVQEAVVGHILFEPTLLSRYFTSCGLASSCFKYTTLF